MASSLIGGFVKQAGVQAAQILVSEPYKPLREKLAAAGYGTTESNLEVVRQSDLVWLAVKPDVIPDVMQEISPAMTSSSAPLVVSIAAGVSTSAIEQALPPGARVVRVMPNLPCLVGECAAGLCRGRYATAADADKVRAYLSSVGTAAEVSEKLLDAVTGLSGSGPAYVFLAIEAMADGGVRAGLPRPTAIALAAQTVKGAAAMVLETGKHPGELKDQVCSPGGTSIAGVEALEGFAFRAALIKAVGAAARRATELRPPQPKL